MKSEETLHKKIIEIGAFEIEVKIVKRFRENGISSVHAISTISNERTNRIQKLYHRIQKYRGEIEFLKKSNSIKLPVRNSEGERT